MAKGDVKFTFGAGFGLVVKTLANDTDVQFGAIRAAAIAVVPGPVITNLRM